MKKIDFMAQLEELGFKVLLPREVYEELKDLRKDARVNREKRTAIDVALELMGKKKVKNITLGAGKVDEGMIKKGRVGYYIATLDNGIKRSVPNKVVINDAQKRVAVERE
jgi:rRNA-processing protein FCF1